MNDLTESTTLAPRWCHWHEQWECAYVKAAADWKQRGFLVEPGCCHAPATDGPYCRPHVPAPVPAAAP